MNELDDLREQVARRTEERRTAWLRQQRGRYLRWMFTAGVFALLVTVIAALAVSAAFGIVAGYLWLFAWNRWMEYRRVERWLSRPKPTNHSERVTWARVFYQEWAHPSVWLTVSTWVGAISAALCVLAVSVVVVAMSGFWMRLLYGFAYALVGLHVFVWISDKRKYSRELKAYLAL
ncbi:MAG: hypothetical protein WA463_06180, partial [Terriglobales bacterium]